MLYAIIHVSRKMSTIDIQQSAPTRRHTTIPNESTSLLRSGIKMPRRAQILTVRNPVRANQFANARGWHPHSRRMSIPTRQGFKIDVPTILMAVLDDILRSIHDTPHIWPQLHEAGHGVFRGSLEPSELLFSSLSSEVFEYVSQAVVFCRQYIGLTRNLNMILAKKKILFWEYENLKRKRTKGLYSGCGKSIATEPAMDGKPDTPPVSLATSGTALTWRESKNEAGSSSRSFCGALWWRGESGGRA